MRNPELGIATQYCGSSKKHHNSYAIKKPQAMKDVICTVVKINQEQYICMIPEVEKNEFASP